MNATNCRHAILRGMDTPTQTNSTVENATVRIVVRDMPAPLGLRVLRGIMHVVCALLLLLVCALGLPRIFGVQEFNVLTGSMTPAYPVGTLVFVVPCEPAELQVGDVVSCVMNEQLDVITHRVVANDPAAGTITTRGDANNSDDAPTLYANVIGKVSFSVPYAGSLMNFFTNSSQGRILGIGLLVTVVALTLLSESLCTRMTKQVAEVHED